MGHAKPSGSSVRHFVFLLHRRRLVPSCYLCVLGVREWCRAIQFPLPLSMRSRAHLNLTPNPLSPPKHINSDWVRVWVFRENSKWWTKILTRLTWVSRLKKVIEQFYWLITFFGFNWTWGQIYTKVLRNLTFVVQFLYFRIRPKKCFVCFSSNVWANFVTKIGGSYLSLFHTRC